MSFDLGKYIDAAYDFFWSLVLSIVEMIKDVFIWIFEQFMDLIAVILDGISFSLEALDITQYFDSLPADVSNIMGLIGLGTCTQMIGVSILIRLGLQLIPFVRLGS